jgi:alkanesulfonate monooxygenase SsuD/methylene tetrahydromethanopterin reductase-like flavin-dependent oxidoreductase (luciferase family)
VGLDDRRPRRVVEGQAIGVGLVERSVGHASPSVPASAAMPFFGIRFDLRNPSFAETTMHERYAAALDMAAWAERVGFVFVGLSEHHGSEDGYLPSPLVMAGAVAARTTNVAIVVAAMIAPFHDPLRLAEDAAVVDNLCGGRLELIVAGGYVPHEFAMFGVELSERARRTTEVIQTLQAAWTGEPFEYRGRTVQVAPKPHRPGGPGLQLGGSSPAAARRAARLGVGFQPSNGDSWPAYAEECVKQGRPDPGPYPGGDTTVTFVAKDPDAYWDKIAPYAMHESNAYGAWAEAAGIKTGYETATSAGELLERGQYRVVTPEGMVEELTAAGPAGFAIFHPMLGGIPPILAWEGLHLFEHDVLPRLD